MTLDEIQVTASASIVQGKVSRRVVMRGTRGRRARPRLKGPPVPPRPRPGTEISPRRALARLQRSKGIHADNPLTTICISLTAADLYAMDDLADMVQMSRSHLIRQAVAHFRAKIEGG